MAEVTWKDVRSQLVRIRNVTPDGQMIFMLHWIIEEGDAETGSDRYTQLGRYILLMEERQRLAWAFRTAVIDALELD